MPLRVLFVTTTYPLQPGDAIPGFVADLAQALVADHGVHVRVIAPHHPGAAKQETVKGVEIIRFQYTLNPQNQCLAYGHGIPDNLKNFPRAKFQLPAFFAAMAIAIARQTQWANLIHAHWIEPALIAMTASHRARPMVVSIHSLKPKISKLHRFTLARADRVFFNSQFTLSQAREKNYACDARVIYQGYDQSRFPAPKTDATFRQHLQIAPTAKLIVALGRWIEVKGLHILAQAADTILSAHPDAHLIIAGDGPQRPRIESILSQSIHKSRVHLPGALSREKVAQLLSDADLFINPGIIDSNGRAEGLGITTIEAQASGVPCIGSRVGGIAETIEHEKTGLLIPAGDVHELVLAVNGLLSDDERRKRFAQNAIESARRRFTWKSLAGQVLGQYHDVLQRRKTASAQ